MIMKVYKVEVETNTFKTATEQTKFISRFVKFINSCNYSKIPATMIEVVPEKVNVTNHVFTSAKVSVEVVIVKPENEEKITKKLYAIEDKMNDVRLLGITLVNQM